MKCYAVADYAVGNDRTTFLERIELLSRLSVDMIQLRAKTVADRELIDLARDCRQRIGGETVYLVNGRPDVALAAGADGVHLPSDGVPLAIVRTVAPELIVGQSCHTVEEVERAADEGADFVVLGPVFDARSTRKEGTISRADLEEAAKSGAGVYALGGFDLNRVGELKGTGVAGVAGITMFMRDEPIDGIIASIHEVCTA